MFKIFSSIVDKVNELAVGENSPQPLSAFPAPSLNFNYKIIMEGRCSHEWGGAGNWMAGLLAFD
jgi:hypothetical protein